MAGLNQEIWTDVLIQDLSKAEDASFLEEIQDYDHLVMTATGKNYTIHLVDIGVDPNVLINNTVYPIPVAAQTDNDIPINLDKYQTEVTSVSDDEIEFITYDKISKVQEKHRSAINKSKFAKAAHSLSPVSNTVETPIVLTTGPDDGTGRKMMLKKDLITLKRKLDKLEAGDDRVLVLCSDHYNDLTEDDKMKNLFEDQNLNDSSGKLNKLISGFKIYTYSKNPYFDATASTKKDYGSVPGANDYQGTFCFLSGRAFKARAGTKNYTDEPKPRTQQWEYNVRHHFITMPMKMKGVGAIISANA